MVKINIIIATLLMLAVGGTSQDQANEVLTDKDYFWSKSKEVGLNFTPLISKVIPFNLGDTDAGFRSFTYKRYGYKYALRLNAGLQVSNNSVENDFILLAIGYERRRPITAKVTYTTGLDVGLFGFIEGDGGGYISKFFGFEYHFDDRYFVATEGNIQYSVQGFSVNPPVSVFFFVRL